MRQYLNYEKASHHYEILSQNNEIASHNYDICHDKVNNNYEMGELGSMEYKKWHDVIRIQKKKEKTKSVMKQKAKRPRRTV